jgi:pilus assembly protein Flp/PilA
LRSFRRLFRRITPVLRNPRGATAVEYGLIVAFIVIVMVVALKQVANANTDMWRNVSEKVSSAG